MGCLQDGYSHPVFPVSVALSVSSVATPPRKRELKILLFFGWKIFRDSFLYCSWYLWPSLGPPLQERKIWRQEGGGQISKAVQPCADVSCTQICSSFVSLPVWFTQELTKLALPVVAERTGYNGWMRAVVERFWKVLHNLHMLMVQIVVLKILSSLTGLINP